MKIIIAYASAGSGHSRAARAIYDCIKNVISEREIKIIDTLRYTNLLFAKLYSSGYYLLVTHLRPLWEMGYHLSNSKFICRFFNFLCRLNCGRFNRLLISENPDVIVVTHFLPAAMAAYLKGRSKISSRLITIVTDFGVHYLWVYKNCDDYIAAMDYTRNQLIKRNIDSNKIRVLGIPISPEFSAKSREHRETDEFTALLVTGSFGFSLIEGIVNMLYSELRMIVVCGNNQKLYYRLKNRPYPNIRLFGFTNNMPALMSQANLVITKAGGLTISESLTMELPMVFIGSIPGQETENARILSSCNCGIEVRNLRELKAVIINLKNSPERLSLMRQSAGRYKKPDAAERISRYIFEICTHR